MKGGMAGAQAFSLPLLPLRVGGRAAELEHLFAAAWHAGDDD